MPSNPFKNYYIMKVPTNTFEDSVLHTGIYYHSKACRSLINKRTRRTTLRRHLERTFSDGNVMANKLRIAFAIFVAVTVLAQLFLA